MCLQTWAVCSCIGCATRTGLYKLKKCPKFDERTETCSVKITESTKLIKGDIPCLDCAKKDAAAEAKQKVDEIERSEPKSRKRDKLISIFR